jgi:hypothetical protein
VKNDLDETLYPDHYYSEQYCNCSLRLPALTLDNDTTSLELRVAEGDDFDVPKYLLAALRRLTPQSHLKSLQISACFKPSNWHLQAKPPMSLAILDSVVCLGKLQSLQLYNIPIGFSGCQKIIAHLPDLR